MCRSKNAFFIFSVIIIIYLPGPTACRSGQADALFSKVSSSSSGIDFENKLKYTDSLSVLDFEYMFNGSGVALIDVNNDGLQDIFFGGNMVSCKLYLNKGHLKFEDITAKAGITTTGWVDGISVADINQDGFQDIYVCKAGNRRTPASEMKNIFFINNGNGTFTDQAAKMGLDDDGYDIHAAFLDYDKDGDLDMYLLRNAFVNYNRNTARNRITDGGAPSTDKLFRNNGNMTFTDVSKQAGIVIEGFGLGVTVCDLNNDNWPDIYVSNDFITNDLMWINNGNGSFTNRANEYLKHQTYNGMGNDVADFNNDGLEDIMVVDMLPPDNKRWKLTMRGNTYEEFENALSFGYQPQYVRNTLQLNNGNGSFSEIGQLSGVQATEWSWAPLFADFDNDGYKDIFVSNGYRQDITNLDFIKYGKNALFVGTNEGNRKERLDLLNKYPGIKIHNYLFSNNRDLTFKDVSQQWGMDDDTYSNGAAYGDLDNDGDLDLVINNLDQPASLYENRSANIHKENSWLRIGFKGAQGNKAGTGAKVWLWQNGMKQVNYYSPYRGYLSTMEPFLHFGLASSKIDSIKVEWPDGKKQTIQNVHANQLLWLENNKAAKTNDTIAISTNVNELFTSFKDGSKIDYKHVEDKFVDFKSQPLIPHLLSHEGPGIAVGDVNGDGLEDFFIGAGSGSTAVIFTQQKNASFLRKELNIPNLADNMGAILFDADNDGDNDLYVAAGGSAAVKKNDTLFRHHLFLNDGKGNFTEKEKYLPEVITSGSSVSACDYDQDGDLDLFVAGRLSPGEYPLSPRSYLLRNDFTKFTDVTGDLSLLGMVTAALWTDFDNDHWTDLIIAGEFMPIRFFKNDHGKLREVTNETGLKNTSGWWNSITAGDFDKDGDMDYVAGNLGLNSPFKATAQEPVCVYAADYDKDGRIDPVICHYIDGEEYIIHSRDDINRQMAPMRGRFRTYEDYADVNFSSAFRESEKHEAKVLKSEMFESSFIENIGGGKFKIRALPKEAQFAPLYAMIGGDFNGDGNPDLLGVGNSYSTEVQTGRYDAQGSLLLLGDGSGNLVPQRNRVKIDGDNKSIVQLSGVGGKDIILVGSNSDSLKVYRQQMLFKKIKLQPMDVYAIITEKNGKKFKDEFYYGHSYLSQSGRYWSVPAGASEVEIVNSTGSKRKIKF